MRAGGGGGGIVKVIAWLLIQIHVLFLLRFSHNLVVVLIYTYKRSGSRVLNVQFRCLCGDQNHH